MADYDDPVEYILEELRENYGITMSYETVDLIVGYYLDFKFNQLMSGYGIREKGLVSLIPWLRYTNNFQGDNVPVLKINASYDDSLVKALASRVCNSEEVRSRLNLPLSEADIEYLRRKYEL